MRGKCIDTGGSTNLKIGEVYYLFPHGGSTYNVSCFPCPGAHFGTYQKNRFEIIKETETVEDVSLPEPKETDELPLLEAGKVYEGELIWRKAGYDTPLGKYFITATYGCYANKNDCYFYTDAELQNARGRFPLRCFANIREYGLKELPKEQWQQIDLFNL